MMENVIIEAKLVRDDETPMRERLRLAAGEEARPRPSATAISRITPTRNEAKRLSDVIDLANVGRGWRPKDDEDQDVEILAWYVVLAAAGVPSDHYLTCYQAAVRTRVELRSKGEIVSHVMGAEDVAAEWPGVRRLLEERLVRSGKLIAQTARPHCPDCFGTGQRHVPLDPETRRPDSSRPMQPPYATVGKCDCKNVQV